MEEGEHNTSKLRMSSSNSRRSAVASTANSVGLRAPPWNAGLTPRLGSKLILNRSSFSECSTNGRYADVSTGGGAAAAAPVATLGMSSVSLDSWVHRRRSITKTKASSGRLSRISVWARGSRVASAAFHAFPALRPRERAISRITDSIIATLDRSALLPGGPASPPMLSSWQYLRSLSPSSHPHTMKWLGSSTRVQFKKLRMYCSVCSVGSVACTNPGGWAAM